MKKNIFLLGILLFLAGCIEKPEIKIKDIRVEGMSKGEVRLKVLLDIFNSNPTNINLTKIDFLMYYDGKAFGNGSWEGSESIDAESGKVLPVSVVADQETIVKALFAYFGEGSPEAKARLSLDGRAIISKFGMSFSKDFQWKYKEKKKDARDQKKDTRDQKKDIRDHKKDARIYKPDVKDFKIETRDPRKEYGDQKKDDKDVKLQN